MACAIRGGAFRKTVVHRRLGIGQIASWGTLYYSFPLIAERMGQDLGLSKPEVYGAATIGLLIASFTAYPVGVAIGRGYGQTVMALSSRLAGILLLLWSQIASLWALYPLLAGIGLAQAMTLYEPAFAVVARRYGSEARRGITALTLWGGFASTVFVPLIQLLLNAVDWRSTLVVLGVINLVLCAPLYLSVIDAKADARLSEPAATSSAAPLTGRGAVRWVLHQRAFWGLLVAFTVYYGIFSGLSFHMYSLLLERGFDTATVVAVIAVLGPAQVAGRIAVWSIAERVSVRIVGKVVVLAFPIAVGYVVGFANEHPVARILIHERPEFLHQLVHARLLALIAQELLELHSRPLPVEARLGGPGRVALCHRRWRVHGGAGRHVLAGANHRHEQAERIGERRGRGVIRQIGVLEDREDDVEPKAIHTQVEPEARGVLDRLLDLGVAPVEVGLLREVEVIVVLAGHRVQLPCRSAEDRDPVVRRATVLAIAPDVPVALGTLAPGARLAEPGVLDGGVVEHEVEDDVDAARGPRGETW